MRVVSLSFSQMLRQMKRDPMLIAILITPVIIGVIFRFGIPFAEMQLTDYLVVDYFISPYYGLLDLLLVIFTPTMFGFVVAMVVLEEADEHIVSYLSVTPLGKTGYLVSRFGITSLFSLLVSLLIFVLFHLTDMNVFMLFGLLTVSAAQGVSAAMLIVTLAANKVEGMAVGKFTSLFTLGTLAPFFISGNVQYIFTVIPSFWIAKAIEGNRYSFLLIALFVVIVWVFLLAKRFTRKIF